MGLNWSGGFERLFNSVPGILAQYQQQKRQGMLDERQTMLDKLYEKKVNAELESSGILNRLRESQFSGQQDENKYKKGQYDFNTWMRENPDEYRIYQGMTAPPLTEVDRSLIGTREQDIEYSKEMIKKLRDGNKTPSNVSPSGLPTSLLNKIAEMSAGFFLDQRKTLQDPDNEFSPMIQPPIAPETLDTLQGLMTQPYYDLGGYQSNNNTGGFDLSTVEGIQKIITILEGLKK